MKSRLLPMGFALWAAATSMSSEAGDIGFTCRMKVPAAITAGAKVPLKFSLTNVSPGAVNVLVWNTPLEGLTGRFLRVTAPDGSELEYGGPMVKRAPPDRDDYLRMRKGSTRQRTVDIARAYSFTQDGTYRIAFIGQLADVSHSDAKVPTPPGQFVPLSVPCPEVKLVVRQPRQ